MIKSFSHIKKAYFIGIGGIGMSALARYFCRCGIAVSGYDRTKTPLTQALCNEGIEIHYTEDIAQIPLDVDIVIYTPAIPPQHAELRFYRENGYPLKKRAEILGWISADKFTIAVAGTHGKTTVSSMITHILQHSGYGCTAFVGGIMSNYDSNFVLGNNQVLVVEADEYDRSFLQLQPSIAVITAVDPDHLDIYGTAEEMLGAYRQFAAQIKPNGLLLVKQSLPITAQSTTVTTYNYHLSQANATSYITDIEIDNDKNYHFTLQLNGAAIPDCQLGIHGLHNVENALAAATVAHFLGIELEAIREALRSFSGIKRRFEYLLRQPNIVLIDDYAHHPEEIRALLMAVRHLYPNRQLTAIFQPHLYTRTRDFADGFADALSLADEVVLTDLYPAREEPIAGISEATIADKITIPQKNIVAKVDLLRWLAEHAEDLQVVLLIGAGDLSDLAPDIAQQLLAAKHIVS